MSARVEAVGVPIVYEEEHSETAAAMAEAVERTAELVQRHWNLPVPPGCEVHVLTDCLEFIDRTAPPGMRFLTRLSRPLWRGRAERAFALAGGWTIPWRGGPVVGVKPPELLERAETRLGDRLFVKVPDLLEKVRHLTCHEFTHACSAHLRLPPWLNEGLAMRAVDHMTGTNTVLDETRDLADTDGLSDRRSYRRAAAGDHDALIRLYASGYWITRELEEASPTVLTGLLERKRPAREVTRIALEALR